jgi:tripartite-type tricarboxylate transporter receptor subunit TctC
MRKLFIAVAVTLASIGSATAQAPTLAGKNVNIIIGAGSGGGIDQWGRTVARHIGKHLPGNLTVVPQNMNGGGASSPPIISTPSHRMTARYSALSQPGPRSRH